MIRSAISILPAVLIAGVEPAWCASPEEALRPLIRQHCVKCHGARRQKAEIDLEALLAQRPLVRNLDVWRNVLRQVQDREMPPDDRPALSASEFKTFTEALDQAVNRFDYESIRNPGHLPPRRLTAREYANTARDLLGVDAHALYRFPTDATGTSGFDNSGNTLFLQTNLWMRYLDAADRLVEAALPDRPATKRHHATRRHLWGASRVPASDAEVEAALRRFCDLAYRRPAAGGEVRRAVEMHREAEAAGADALSALRRAMKYVMVTPPFLMRIESRRNTNGPYPVDDHDLANRLSYFLWSSMPDGDLRRAAESGALRTPEGLNAQVDRMLQDPRSKTVGRDFASQWLGFDQVGKKYRRDPLDRPEFTDSLYASMRDETAMLMHFVIRDNRSIKELIDPGYTFVNEELARYYRLEGVKGPAMQRVALPDARRGGIFTHAGLLMVTAYPDRTSPVLRGTWILSDVLGTPPPPPPPNVEELDDRDEDSPGTLRQKLERHRASPKCSSCHSKIDPLGFALENYNEDGRWRKPGDRQDDRAQLPNGTKFKGPDGLKKVIVQERMGDFTRQMTRKMLAYALGRQLEYYDEGAVRKIVKAVEADGHRAGTLVKQIVTSFPFRFKANPETIPEHAP